MVLALESRFSDTVHVHANLSSKRVHMFFFKE